MHPICQLPICVNFKITLSTNFFLRYVISYYVLHSSVLVLLKPTFLQDFALGVIASLSKGKVSI